MNYAAFEQLERLIVRIEDESWAFTLGDWCEEPEPAPQPPRRRWWWPWRRRVAVTVPAEVPATAFCLMGWAAQDPWFVERGFRLGGGIEEPRTVVCGEEEGWPAVAALLGITEDEALFLLDGANYGRGVTPTEVGIRLRAFVLGKRTDAVVDARRRLSRDETEETEGPVP